MKLLGQLAEFIIKVLAGSVVWLIVAVVLSFPLGLILLKISDGMVLEKEEFYTAIDHNIEILYLLFVATCFVGIIISRVVAVAIRTLAESKLAQKSEKDD